MTKTINIKKEIIDKSEIERLYPEYNSNNFNNDATNYVNFQREFLLLDTYSEVNYKYIRIFENSTNIDNSFVEIILCNYYMCKVEFIIDSENNYPFSYLLITINNSNIYAKNVDALIELLHLLSAI